MRTASLRTTLFLATVFTLLLSIATARASGDLALEGLEVLRRGFAGMDDFTADITQEKQIALMKKRLTAKGVVRFRKPGSFYMEVYPPYASRLLLQGNALEMLLPAEGVHDRLTLPPEESLDRWFAYLARPVTSLPEGAAVRAEHRGDQWLLRVSPRGKGGMKELQLAFDGKGKLNRLVFEERNGDRTMIRFHNLRANTGLSARDFVLQ